MRRGDHRVLSGAFGLFPCALSVVTFVQVLSAHSRTPGGSYNAFGPFPRSLGVLGFVRVRSVRSLAPWGSSGSFVCVQSIPVRLGDRQVCLCAFGPLPCGKGVLVWVRSIPIHLGRRHVRPWGRRVRSGAFGTFPCPLSLVPTPLHLI